MMAAHAAKRRKDIKTEINDRGEVKEGKIQSIYFNECNESPSIHLRKKLKLKTDEEGNRISSEKLGRTFYDQPTEILAKELLGKLIYRVLDDDQVLCGRIVETEGYLGEVDKACHAYGGKRTERTEAVFMAPGTAYVYFIYGMYHCLNISSQEPGACVLIRALEPLQGELNYYFVVHWGWGGGVVPLGTRGGESCLRGMCTYINYLQVITAHLT